MTLRGRLWAFSGLPAWPSVALLWAAPMPTLAGMSDEIGDDFAMTEKLLRVMSSRCTDSEHSGCLDPNRAAYVRVRAADLRERFIKHMRACQAEYPEMTNRNAIFQAWAVQHLAHLEYFILDLTKRVIALEGKRRPDHAPR